MARIRLDLFSGEIPKIATHKLPEPAAQMTVNAKVDSGMLEAWKKNSVIENTSVASPLTLYKYIQDDGATEDWYVSAEDLDFVDNPQSVDTYERVFFAGAVNDDFVADYVLKGGSAIDSETVAGYDPSTGVITLTTDFTAGDFAVGDYVEYGSTLYKITALDLSGGAGADTVTIQSPPSTMTGTIGIKEILYTSPNYGEKELRFFANDIDGVNPWDGSVHYGVLGVQDPQFAPYAVVQTGDGLGWAEGSLDLSWVYTFVNSYGEEGPPSSPSSVATYATADSIKVWFQPPFGMGTVGEPGMPDDWHYDITQIKLYRTSSGVTSTDFLYSKTVNLSSIENNVLTGTGVTSYTPSTGVIVMTADISAAGIDASKFHYVEDQTNGRFYRITAVDTAGGAGVNNITIADAKPNTLSSTIDIVEWVITDDTVTDDLGDPIATEDYWPPITGLDGLTSMASGHLWAWKDNVLYYSWPYLPHAWKTSDVKSIDHNVVVARGFQNTLCVATDGHPYIFSGQSPRTMNPLKMGQFQPCTSKRCSVAVNNALLFPAREGLIELSTAGTRNITQDSIRRETWVGYDLGNAFAMFRNNRYFCFPNNDAISGFILDYIDGTYLTLSYGAECGYITPDDGIMYFVSIDASEGASGTRRSIKQWEGDTTNYATYTWKSKKTILPRNVNMAVARVELDDDFYTSLLSLIDANDTLEALNAELFAQQYAYEDLGTASYVAGTGVITLDDDIATGTIVPGHHRVEDSVTGYSYPITLVSLGAGAGSCTITLQAYDGGGEVSPPASLSDPIHIQIPKDLQGTLAGGNQPASLDGRYLARHTIAGDMLNDLNSIDASPYVNLTIWADGVLVYSKNVSTAEAFKLPRGYKAKRWEVQFSGTVPVRGFDMATTMKEILK